MIKKFWTITQKEEIEKYCSEYEIPQDIIAEIFRIIHILDENYGVDRALESDGGYPKEWNRILSEYKAIHSKQKQKKCDRLDFYRDDEGYLRKVGEKDNLLRFHFQSDCFTYKNQIAYIMEETKILSFDEYLKYCRLNGKERTLYLQRLKDKLTKEGFQTQEAFQISFETDYDSSDFNNRDIYVDMLNHTYVFL